MNTAKTRAPLPFLLRRSRGFTLIELMVVLAIIAFVAVALANKYKNEAEDRIAAASADNITALGKALASYVSNNTTTLSSAASTAVTIANLQAPTACVSAPCLTSTFQPTSWTGGYTMLIRRLGAVAPFQFESLACAKNAWITDTKPRADLVGAAASRIGGPAALTRDNTNGAYPFGSDTPLGITNYPFSDKVPQLCYFISQSTTALDALYLRTDGQNKMTGALNMNAQDINAAKLIKATDNITSDALIQGNNVTAIQKVTSATLLNSGDATIGGNAAITGNVAVAGNASVTGAATAATMEASGTIKAGGDISTATKLTVTDDVIITSLTSRPSAPTVTSVKSLLPKLVEMNSFIATANGDTADVPICPTGGTPAVFILPHVSKGQATQGLWGSTIKMTGPSGGRWSVQALNESGVPYSAGGQFAAIIRTFCTF